MPRRPNINIVTTDASIDPQNIASRLTDDIASPPSPTIVSTTADSTIYRTDVYDTSSVSGVDSSNSRRLEIDSRNFITYNNNDIRMSELDREIEHDMREYEINEESRRKLVEAIFDKDEKNKKKDKKHECYICGSLDDVNTFPDELSCTYVCKKCLNKFFTICDKCGKYCDKREVFKIGNKQFCSYCLHYMRYKQCFNCKNWFEKNGIVTLKEEPLCFDCIKKLGKQIFKCRECGKYYEEDRYGKDDICISCINCNLRDVLNYSYKPDPRFFSRIGEYDNLFLGVELEMGYVENYDVVNDFVSEYSNNFFYMKKDTSIPIYGCEIVTQPATLQKHLNNKYWQVLLQEAKSNGFSADNDKCGIHVHVSRNFFTNEEIAKLDCFVNTFNFWKRIARRESHYSNYINKDTESWGRQITNRRCALNLSNDNTVEFRIFKGTLEYEYLFAYLEACHASSCFIKHISLNDLMNCKNDVICRFKDFIDMNNYKYLKNYYRKLKVF